MKFFSGPKSLLAEGINVSNFFLYFVSSENQVAAGIPEYIAIHASVPSNIFFTIDGTEPTTESYIYTDPIYLYPGSKSFITLSAFAIDSDGYSSPTFSQTFSADITQIKSGRRISSGIIVDSFDDLENQVLGFDAENNAARLSDLSTKDTVALTKITTSSIDADNNDLSVSVGIPDPNNTSNPFDDQLKGYTNAQYAATFNPFAKTILIDNRIYNEVNFTLRTFGSMNNIYKEFDGKKIRDATSCGNNISGGKVRSFYDRKTNVMVSYYFDHRESRWIKNIQQLPQNKGQTIGHYAAVNNSHVFKWISRGRHQSSNI